MRFSLNRLAGAATALALCASPTMAAAATSSTIRPVSPLAAVSLYGSRASAQTICSQGASAATAAGAAAVQGQAGCVLPATDGPPPVVQGPAYAPPPPATNFGIDWFLLALGAFAVIAGVSTLFDDDDDDDFEVISPA